MEPEHKVGDVVSFHIDSYFLILEIVNNKWIPYKGFGILGEKWNGYPNPGNMVLSFLNNDLHPILVTDESIIEDVLKKYSIYQMTKIIET